MASENLHPLEELKRLDQQVEAAKTLADLKPIFNRLEEIAKQHSGDFELQLVVGDVKQHVVNRGTKLKQQEAPLPEPAPLPARTPEPPTVVMQAPPPPPAPPPSTRPADPPTVVMQAPPLPAPPPPATPPAPAARPAEPPTVVMQSPFPAADAPKPPAVETRAPAAETKTPPSGDKLPEDLKPKRLVSSGQFSAPGQAATPPATPPVTPPNLAAPPTVIMPPPSAPPPTPAAAPPTPPPAPTSGAMPKPDAPTVVIRPDAKKDLGAPTPAAMPRHDAPTVVIRPDAKSDVKKDPGGPVPLRTSENPVPPKGGAPPPLKPPTGPPPSGPNWKRALGIGALVGLLLAAVGVGVVWYTARGGNNPMSGAVPVQIATTPTGAAIQINGEPNCTSDCTAALAPGTYQIAALLDGYEPAMSEITVEAGGTGTLNLALTPLPSSLRILADLNQGAVTMDGQPVGSLQDGQFVVEGVEPGSHTIAVTSGTSEASFSIDLAAARLPAVTGNVSTKNLLAVIVASFANQARVVTSSGPMKLVVNGQAQGDVSPSGVDLANYQAGVAEMVLGEGTQQRTLQESFGPAPMITAFLKSEANVGTLIVATGENDVRVFLNDREYPRKTSRGVLRIQTIGRVNVRVTKDGFEDSAPQTVTVAKGSEARLTFNLKALPDFSTLDITGGTPGAEVLIDGNVIGTLALTTGGFRNRSIDPGSHTIELRRTGYQAKRFDRTFRRGQTVTLAPPDAVLAAERTEAPPPPPPAPKVEAPAPPKVTAAPKPRTGTMANFDAPEAWREEEGVWRHRGAAHLTYSMTPANGVFSFTIHRLRGGSIFRAGRVRWMIQYVDSRNYSFYEMDDESFWSKVVQNGKELERAKVKHGLDKEARSWPIQVDLSPQAAVVRAQRNGEWVVLDRWAEPGRNFTDGKFGILVRGNDEVGLTDFRFAGR